MAKRKSALCHCFFIRQQKLQKKNTTAVTDYGAFMEERVGFEPTDAYTSPVFKTGSFNRSDISPKLT